MSLGLVNNFSKMSEYSPILALLFVATPSVLPGTFAFGQHLRFGSYAKGRINWVMPVLTVAHVVDLAAAHWQSRQHSGTNISVVTTTGPGSILIWLILSIWFAEQECPHWVAYLTAWFSSALASLGLLLRNGADLSVPQKTLTLLRVLLLIAAISCSLLTLQPYTNAKLGAGGDASEKSSAASISGDDDSSGSVSDGTDDDADGDDDEDEEKLGRKMQQERIAKVGGWFNYLKTMTTFLPYVLPYQSGPMRRWFLVYGLCTLYYRAAAVLIPRQLGDFTEALTQSHGTGNLPIGKLAIYGLFKFVLGNVVSLVQDMASNRLSQQGGMRLNGVAFSHVMGLSMDYHTSKSTGKVIRAIEQGSDVSYLYDSFVTIAPICIDFVVSMVVLAKTIGSEVGYTVVIVTILSAYVSKKGSDMMEKHNDATSKSYEEESSSLYDIVSNWYTVAIHNRGSYESNRYADMLQRGFNLRCFTYDMAMMSETLQRAIMDVGYLIAIYIASCRAVDASATVSDVVFLTSYWESITRPLSSIVRMVSWASGSLISAEWLYQLLNTKPSVQDKPNANALRVSGSTIEFKDVSFSYDDDRHVLRGVSFTAETGQSVALVGETGSGKSTILKLLWRFYDVASGSITIDGQDLRDVTISSLRTELGIVPQEPSVFDLSIMQNLKYAKPDCTDEEVYAACKAARIHDQIMKFSKKYNSKIGERGVRLSGGELQRLAIARVLLRQPSIVILDEATSSVDSDTEASVQEAIKELSKGRTVVTVAHRLSTVVGCDVILVLDKGEIIERGSHQELVEKGGRYAHLWSLQTRSS